MFCLFSLVSAPAPSRRAVSAIGAPHSSIKYQSILNYDNHMKEPCRRRATHRLLIVVRGYADLETGSGAEMPIAQGRYAPPLHMIERKA
jgi:hypothetical protein